MSKLIKDEKVFRTQVFNRDEFYIGGLLNAITMIINKLLDEGISRKGLESDFYFWDEYLISDYSDFLDSETIIGDLSEKSDRWIRESIIEMQDAWRYVYSRRESSRRNSYYRELDFPVAI